MWCYRVPGRACSPPKLTTPFSPSPSPVWFSTRWGRPTSASWWTFTVSHMLLISLQTHFLLPAGRSHRAEMHFCRVPCSRLTPPVCFCCSSRPNSVGGATADNGRRRLRCHPELQMGWKPSAHTDMVQKGFKHGKRLSLKAFFSQHSHLESNICFFPPDSRLSLKGMSVPIH